MGMKVDGKYNFVNGREKLVYMGKEGPWHQFALVDKPGKVWAEVLEMDLSMLEETSDA